MPSIRLTDANVRNLKLQKSTWFTDDRRHAFPGLRLCVSQTCKTFYLAKRDPHTRKVVSVKLGRFPDLSVQAAWKKAEAEAARIHNGTVRNEMPTVREMLERYIARQTRNGRLSARTAEEYRALARCHLTTWLDLPLDRVRAVDVTDRLEELKVKSPYAATKAAVILGATFRLAQDQDLDVKVPTRAFDPVPVKQREIDTSIPWAVRRAEIDAVRNTVKRVAWLLLWHTGIRSGNLRGLTWQDVDLDRRTVRLARMKNGLSRTLPLSDISAGLFKQLAGLHPRWVFPAARGDGHLDHLDRLPSMSQHHLRHLWVDAAAACHLPSYIIAFLKGDVVKADEQEMVAHYMHDLGDDAAPNAISEKIEQKCRCLPIGT